MPKLKTYSLFISHAWQYDAHYTRLVNLLNEGDLFAWKNFSVPEHDPVLDPEKKADRKKLTEELAQQIRPTHCVLVIAGMYVHYRDWIQTEIVISQQFGKPVIGVKPWGHERVPQEIQQVSNCVVNWNSASIITAIRSLSI